MTRSRLVLAATAMGGLLAVFGAMPGAVAARSAQPALLEIATVPPVSGMTFALDGRRFASRGDGIARIEYDGAAPLRNRLVAITTVTRPGVRATLGRWYGNLDRPGQTKLTAALGLSYAVNLSFTDLRGKAVDPRRIRSVTLRSSNGVIQRIARNRLLGPQWLPGVRTVSTPFGPRDKDILMSVERVIVDGTNVVNRAQQRFRPRLLRHPERAVEIALLFYSARFHARDALFAFPLGSGVRLRHPDGRWTYHDFGDSAEIVVDGLARGEYWVEVDAPGISFLRPVTLTRNQDVELEVLSFVDIGLTLGILVATALGLLYIGRPHLFGRRRAGKPLRPPAWSRPAAEGALARGSLDPGAAILPPLNGPITGRSAVAGHVTTSPGGLDRTARRTRSALGPGQGGTAAPGGAQKLQEVLDNLGNVLDARRPGDGIAEVRVPARPPARIRRRGGRQ